MTPADLSKIELVSRTAYKSSETVTLPASSKHPFELRGINGLPDKIRELFDDGHYAESSFAALKYLDKAVQRHSGSVEIGKSLMMNAFQERSPLIRIGDVTNETGRNEQEGFKFICAGIVLFVRNPRGHEVALADSPDQCLDYLGVVSMLLREMAKKGYS